MIKAILKLILGIALLLLVIIIGPLAGIWSLNTLFPVLNIPYTWQTWLAYLVIVAPVTGLRFRSK
jgi:hypothetical protein